MESSHKPGNLTCLEVRDSLSDLIDVRRGELPHPDGTLLSESGMRAALELHLAGCQGCRDEIFILEETGAAFVDFNVGELPVQHFADYGSKVRARMAQTASAATNITPIQSRGSIFAKFALSSLAAASVVMAISFGLTPPARPTAVANADSIPTAPVADMTSTPATVATAEKTPGSAISNPLPPVFNLRPSVMKAETAAMNVMHPKRNVREYDPAKHSLSGLQKDEGELGYLIFSEKTTPGQRPLLGVYLRTTREVDRSVDDKLGLLVLDVVRGSPAHVMGIKPGDYIVTLVTNSTEIAINNGGSEDAVKLLTAVHDAGNGAEIKLQVVRPEGSQHQFRIPSGTLGEYKE